MGFSTRARSSPLLLALVALALSGAGPLAHEVPSDVRIQMFLKPEGQRVRVLLRVPMASINDINWPQRADGMLDIANAEPSLREAVDQAIVDYIEVHENDRPLEAPRVAAVRVSLPSDQSFDSFDRAMAHVTGPPLSSDTELVPLQGMLDVLLEYEIQSDRSDFSVRPDFNELGVTVLTVLRFVPPDGPERVLSLHDDPGLVRLDPSWTQAARIFIGQGFFHILDGIDHLLFLLCLVIPFRRFGSLIPVVTAFTVAHSITLIASAYDMAPSGLWFPPFVETLIAASIVYMALENFVFGARSVAAALGSTSRGLESSIASGLRRRWIVTFAFGLVHGFGFSFALREELQLAGAHVLTSLLAFNAGVELGQLVVLALVIPVLHVAFRRGLAEGLGTIILSGLVAHTGWHWMIERGVALSLYQFEWPVLDAAFFALLLRWAIIAVTAAGAWWLIVGVFGRPGQARSLKPEA